MAYTFAPAVIHKIELNWFVFSFMLIPILWISLWVCMQRSPETNGTLQVYTYTSFEFLQIHKRMRSTSSNNKQNQHTR